MSTVEADGAGRYVGAVSRRYPEGRPLCGADKGFEDGVHKGFCQRTAGQLTPHMGSGACRWHGGTAPNHVVRGERVAAERAAEQVRHELLALDEISEADIAGVDPRVEVLKLITLHRGRASYYLRRIRDAHDAAVRLRDAAGAGYVELIAERQELSEDDRPMPEHPEQQTARHDFGRVRADGGVTAMVGMRFDVDKFGRIYGVGEDIRPLVKLEKESLDAVAKCCALAAQMKIDDTRIELAKQHGLMIQTVMVRTMTRLGIEITDERVSQILLEEMDAVEGAGVGA